MYKYRVTKLYTMAPNICGYLVWNLLRVFFCGVCTFEVAAGFSKTLYNPGKEGRKAVRRKQMTMKQQDNGLKDKGKEEGRERW